MRLLTDSLCIMLLAATSGAATYYVDYEAGLDTNAGTSTGAAWKHCPGDTNATDTADGTTLAAGDSIYFKGGVIYTGRVFLTSSGTPGNPITFDGNEWGTGNALMEGPAEGNAFRADSASSNIVIRSFELRDFAYSAFPYSGSPIRFGDGAENVWLEDLLIWDVGIHTNDGSTVSSEVRSGAGILLYNPVNSTVTNCTIHHVGGSGVGFVDGVGSLVVDTEVHSYTTWGIDISCSSDGTPGPVGHVIRNCVLYDMYHYDNGYWGVGENPHQDFVFIRRSACSTTWPQSNVVESTTFYNNESFDEYGGTAMIFLSYTSNTVVRNCVFINPHSFVTVDANYGSKLTEVYNNTLYTDRGVSFFASRGGSSGSSTSYNNAIYAALGFEYDTTNHYPTAEDYSAFLMTSDDDVMKRISPYIEKNLSEWRVTGYEDNGFYVTNLSDFAFVSTNGYPTNCAAMDLSIGSGSVLIDAGTPLGSFSSDHDGNTRPSGSAWDIGAYEFDQGEGEGGGSYSDSLDPQGRPWKLFIGVP